MQQLQFPQCADAYFEWGLHVGFAGFGDTQPLRVGTQIGLLVEWKTQPMRPQDLPAEIKIAALYLTQKFATLTVDAPWIETPAATEFFNAFVRRLELATPVTPYEPSPSNLFEADSQEFSGSARPQWQPGSDVLVACIDDAFPIGSPRFFKNGLTRVLRIWDQQRHSRGNAERPWLQLDNQRTGLPGTDFSYGGELLNPKGFQPSMPWPLPAQPVQLPQHADLADDQGYYQHAGLARMRFRATHGAYVLDVLAGPIQVRSRISPDRDLYAGGNGSTFQPPDWKPATDVANHCDLVLVQLPDYAVNDPSGRWLGRNVLDGLHYIAQAAGPRPNDGGRVKKVVVNLSWGPQTGPHDGTSLLERAIDDLIDTSRTGGRELAVVLPAGNSFSSRAHAQFPLRKGCQDLVWCVPPGSTTPAFLEVWWPHGATTGAISVRAPDGQVLTLATTAIEAAPSRAWGVTCVVHGNRRMALLALAPTFGHTPAASTAPHGQWRISVDPDATAAGDVHLLVARADHNMGARRKSPASYLFDPLYEQMWRGRDGKFAADLPRASVRRDATLNGLATGRRTYVAGGYRLADQHVSWYSSSGPSHTRIGPNYIYPCDESIALFGLQAGAVRDGTVIRLVGTSAAAPQLARAVASSPLNLTGFPPVEPRVPHKRKGFARR